MPRKERERRYITQCMKDTYPDMNWQLNVELGPIPQELIDRYGMGGAAALFRPTRPRVDAVMWTPEAYYLIEAKLRAIKSGIGDLMFYRLQAKLTYDLPFYDGQPIKAILFLPWMIDWMQAAAKEADIEIKVIWYDWINEYVQMRQNYFTSEWRTKRAETMRLRELFGVE